MPFPPINLHQRISSPGREVFRKKKQTEEKDSEKEKISRSWTTANLRNLGRKPQQQKPKLPIQETEGLKSSWLTLPKQSQDWCESVPLYSSVESTTHRDRGKQSSRSSIGKDEAGEERKIQFSLSLTPEAILVIQKRSLEKQMLAKQQKGCVSVDFRHRRVFPSKRTQGGSKISTIPVANLEHAEDITTIVKISLLNDQYKYDDVEYEEEDGDVDETVVRKCKEWLKGVESAAAFGKVDKLSTLPHLKSC
ncbi:proline-rich protein 18 [Salvelinus alpinus]|uniref:proline-rich protein 18 n=1 Tax=Salvelinus alpinus TaxID=8036 RepID=UPI0039FCD806